ncbi:MAG: AAA family ATPase, partial [Streptosporangiaceae bacterium]
EASQVSTSDLLRIVQAAEMSGAVVVLAGDTEQLGSVDAGGMFRLIAARHGSWKLTEVRRFRNAWEREASLKLRLGDIAALAEYAARGRVYHGPQDRVYDDAVSRWVTDHLDGRDTLLLAASNEEAAHLARLARERLIEYRQVSGANEITLADGNQAGTGDLVRARLNTRIDADGQTLANRDTIRIDGFQDGAFERLAVVSRRTGPGQWSRRFFVPAAYLQTSAELDYAGNVHVAQGRTADTGHLVVSEGMTADQLYTGATRGREKNTIHVVTGAPDPAQPTRAERKAYTAAAIRTAHELRLAGDEAAANAVSLRMPDRPSDRQMAPWEAVLAQAMQRKDPEGTALEAMQAAQDYASHAGHLLELYEAFWRKDVVPQIDEMVRQRVTPCEFARYMKDPERPAFLQVLRAHEIGGRPIPDLLDAITAQPLDGARSIAGVLHGRAGKEPAPARGMTSGWAERAPRAAPPEIEAGGEMMDARQAALGERLAANPPEWALSAWGVPPPEAESAARRADWEKQAGIVEFYREATGITDPAQATGPVPSGKAHLAEAFHASVRALQLPDEAALLRAMNRGQLEAQVHEYTRAEAVAPQDVQAEVGDREHALEEAREQVKDAHLAGDVAAAEAAETAADQHAGDLSRLAVADAARREWREATAAQETAAREATAELRRRGLAGRVPETGAGEERQAETHAEFPERLSQIRAGAEARQEAQAAQEAGPQAAPDIDPELARQAEEALNTPERAAFEADMAELRAADERTRQLIDAMPDREAERQAQRDEIAVEPGIRPQPEASLEATAWEPGTDGGRSEASADVEAELEI